jgi:hypothetical protein
VDLPDRAVLISFLRPDREKYYHRLVVEIAPLSSETAGLHTLDPAILGESKKPANFCFAGYPGAYEDEFIELQQRHLARISFEPVWGVLFQGRPPRFFRFVEEITADEYYATVLPFYKVEIPMQSLRYRGNALSLIWPT